MYNLWEKNNGQKNVRMTSHSLQLIDFFDKGYDND